MGGDMLQVTVPPNSGPGQQLLVKTPDGRTVSAVVPDGLRPGHIFYVQAPPPVVVQGVPVNPGPTGSAPGDESGSGTGDHQHLPQHRPQQQKPIRKQQGATEEMKLLHARGLVKVKVPPGLKAGDRFKVRIPDGRSVAAVVPPGNVSEFHLKAPRKKQNWHDNPLAYAAPMAVGPFIM